VFEGRGCSELDDHAVVFAGEVAVLCGQQLLVRRVDCGQRGELEGVVGPVEGARWEGLAALLSAGHHDVVVVVEASHAAPELHAVLRVLLAVASEHQLELHQVLQRHALAEVSHELQVAGQSVDIHLFKTAAAVF